MAPTPAVRRCALSVRSGRWSGPRRFDLALAALAVWSAMQVVLGGDVGLVVNNLANPLPVLVMLVVAFAQCAPLLAQRRRPTLAAGWSVAAFLMPNVWGMAPQPSNFAVLTSLYVLGLGTSGRRLLLAVGGVLGVVAVFLVVIVTAHREWYGMAGIPVDAAIALALLLGSPVLMGRRVARGPMARLSSSSTPLSASTVAAVPTSVQRAALTNRGNEVFALLADGRSNAEIAEELCISYQTVKTHVRNVLSKTGARDRTHVAVLALRDPTGVEGGAHSRE
ncbi:MAG: response regulator transcription factor [Phycicoccus sp.]